MNVICNKAGRDSTCQFCSHSKTHTHNKDDCRFPCGTNQTDTYCVEVKEETTMKVICDRASKCEDRHCPHRNPHTEMTYCNIGELCGANEIRCVPYEVIIDKPFIIFPKNHPTQSRIPIYAKDKNEAYKKAVEQLGWELE